MSASALSAAIRAKKKKMEMEESGAVKLSGIPEDATDIDILKQHEIAEPNDDNMPKERDESPSVAELNAKTTAPQPHDEMAPDPELDDEKKTRFSKIKSMLSKMGR